MLRNGDSAIIVENWELIKRELQRRGLPQAPDNGWRKQELDEPSDKNSFGHALWRVLGGTDAKADDATRCLRITASELRKILNGSQFISSRYVKEKNWPQEIAAHFQIPWQEHGVHFMQCLENLPPGRRRPTDPVPEKPAVMKKPTPAAYVKPPYSNIDDIRHAQQERARVEKGLRRAVKSFAKKKRKDIGWQVSAKAFIWRARRRYAQLEYKAQLDAAKSIKDFVKTAKARQRRIDFKARPPRKERTPQDEWTPGYALRLILAEGKTRRAEAAGFLNVPTDILSGITGGHRPLTAERVMQGDWRRILAERCPQGWEKHHVFFDALLATGPSRTHYDNEPALALPGLAGALIKKLRSDRGDAIDDILPAVHAQALKEKSIWEKIEAADPSVKPYVLKSAVAEICTIYNVMHSRDATQRKTAMLLIARFG